MLSGAQLLQGFDERLARAEREAAAAQAEAERLAARRDALRAAEAEALRGLAQLRLDALRQTPTRGLPQRRYRSGAGPAGHRTGSTSTSRHRPCRQPAA